MSEAFKNGKKGRKNRTVEKILNLVFKIICIGMLPKWFSSMMYKNLLIFAFFFTF